MNPINVPGVRKNRRGRGVVLQFSHRSAQLESIADSVEKFATNAPDAPTAHAVKGYMEQVRIIADELKRAGR